jgi:hypothetical protein
VDWCDVRYKKGFLKGRGTGRQICGLHQKEVGLVTNQCPAVSIRFRLLDYVYLAES